MPDNCSYRCNDSGERAILEQNRHVAETRRRICEVCTGYTAALEALDAAECERDHSRSRYEQHVEAVKLLETALDLADQRERELRTLLDATLKTLEIAQQRAALHGGEEPTVRSDSGQDTRSGLSEDEMRRLHGIEHLIAIARRDNKSCVFIPSNDAEWVVTTMRRLHGKERG